MSENYENITTEAVEVDAPEVELDVSEVEGDSTEVELDLNDLAEETVNPELGMTTGQKVKVLLMKPLWSAITKWVFAVLGIAALVIYIIANNVSRETGEGLAKAFAGIRNGISSMFSAIPIAMFEIVICAAAVGILAYLVYIIVRCIQVKGAFHKGGLWVQFGYTLIAVASVFTLLFTMCYGVCGYRQRFSKLTDTKYSAANVTNMDFSETMLYLTDNINNTLYNGKSDIFFRKNGLSQYQESGSAVNAITEKVCEAFDAAAEDIPELKGPKLKAKELLFSSMYSGAQISSIYSPITGEICLNADYPEVFVPMQVAKTMAMQRGFTDSATAEFIAFLVCTQYTDDYYLNYSGYLNAYLELSSELYRSNGKDLHLYLANSLHHNAKKEYVQIIKELDELYGISSDIGYTASSESLSGAEYCDISKLLLVNFRDLVDEGTIRVDDTETVDYGDYCNYLTNFYKVDGDFQDAVDETYDIYHPEQ